MAHTNVGELKGAISVGPATLEEHHPRFVLVRHSSNGGALHDHVRTGCESVVCTATPDAHVVTGVWKDGKVGTLRGLRKGAGFYIA